MYSSGGSKEGMDGGDVDTQPPQRKISRREQCVIDATKAKESHSSSKLIGFEVVENSDNVEVQFRVVIDQDTRSVNICCSEDYPDGTLVTVEDQNPEFMRATVAEAVAFVRGQQPQSSPSTSGTGSLAHLAEPDDEPFDSDEDNDDEEDDFQDDNPLHVAEVNKQLLLDLDEVRADFGDPSRAIFDHYSGLDHADIFLLLSCASLQKLAIEAWGLSADEPIVIKLSEVDVALYRSTLGFPKVEAFVQSKQDKKSAVTRQLEFIIDKFMGEHWRIHQSACKENNVFLALLSMLAGRLSTLNDHCVLCDEVQQWKGMLMPTVCLNPLCVFRYETLGIMADVAVLSSQPEVIDLLLEFLRAASFSARSHLILDPYPTVRDPYSTGGDPVLAFDRDSGEDGIQKLRNLLVDIKCRRRLALGDYEYVSPSPKLLMSTVQWMVSSNRAFLVKLDEHRRIEMFGNCRQFLMLSDSPAKEAAFREAKVLAGGSTFLFHGSSFDNWHSILRKGLLVASGTKYQLHGAAYGTGIYLSDQLAMSHGYSSRMSGFGGGTGFTDIVCCDETCCAKVDAKRFLRSTAAVVAVCEVIKTDALKKHGANSIYTLNNAEHCCTRFLLVFEGHQTPSVVLDDKTSEILHKAVSEYTML